MIRLLRLASLCLSGAILFPGLLSAQAIEDEISGFTIDNTITRTGHDFTRFLADYRNTQFTTQNDYNLVVNERPSARWGSLIWVTLDNQEVYRRFLPPGRVDLEQEAQAAANGIHQRAQQQQLQLMLMDTFDLDANEY